MGTVYLLSAVVFNAAANVLFKSVSGMSPWTVRKGALFVLALGLGLVNTLLYVRSLEDIDLGVAFPAYSAASIVAIVLLSVLFLREPVSLQKVVAIITVCVGMLMLLKA